MTETMFGVYVATFFGRCAAPGCLSPVRVGHDIASLLGGGTVHVQCHPSHVRKPDAVDCPICHMQMPRSGRCCSLQTGHLP